MGSLERGFTTDVSGRDDVLEFLVNFLCAVDHGSKLTTSVALVDLAGTHNLVLGILNELIPMSEPAC